MARWYVEAKNGESWRDLSRTFGEWIPDKAVLGSLGWSEGDSVNVGGTTLYCFEFPDHHGEKISLFESWARTTDRLFGIARHGKLHFPRDPCLVFVLPPEKFTPVPPWLK